MAGPSPADDGLAQAVRRVRLAAGSLAGPLDVWTIAVAAAQAGPGGVRSALARLAPPPLARVARLVGDGGAPHGGGAAGGAARPRPAAAAPGTPAAPAAPAAAPTGPAARASAALGVLGRFVTDELTVLGVTAPAAAPAAAQSPFEAVRQAFGAASGAPSA